jgi:hypothetical protein
VDWGKLPVSQKVYFPTSPKIKNQDLKSNKRTKTEPSYKLITYGTGKLIIISLLLSQASEQRSSLAAGPKIRI